MKSRSFSLTDAMILVAAAAAALSVNRTDLRSGFFSWWKTDPYQSVQYVLTLVLPHASAMTAALLAIRMRRPRPTLRRLARQPGVMACEVAMAALLVVVCWAVCTRATGRGIRFSQFVQLLPNKGGRGTEGGVSYPLTGRLLTVYGDRIGFAVAGAWLSLLLSGCWRAERTLIDRLCRAMGWIWVSLTLVLWLRSLLL
jgi:hypothetical protein